MMKNRALLTLAALLMLASVVSASPVMYSQPFDPNSGIAYNSTRYQSQDEYQCFTDFQYDASFTITDFHWWGISLNDPPILDGFWFEIFADNGFGDISSLLYFEFFSGNANETPTGYDFAGRPVNKYSINLTTPWFGAAGNYWFSVVAVSDATRWYWNQTDGVYGYSDWQYDYAGAAWNHVAQADLAFEVTGDPIVPEPGTLMLLGSGLVGLGLFRRRK